MAVSLSSPFAMLSQTSVMFTILDACEGENSTNKEMRNGCHLLIEKSASGRLCGSTSEAADSGFWCWPSKVARSWGRDACTCATHSASRLRRTISRPTEIKKQLLELVKPGIIVLFVEENAHAPA